jgi:hypothetical protein
MPAASARTRSRPQLFWPGSPIPSVASLGWVQAFQFQA